LTQSDDDEEDAASGKKKVVFVCQCGKRCKNRRGLISHQRNSTYHRGANFDSRPEETDSTTETTDSVSDVEYKITQLDEVEFENKKKREKEKIEKNKKTENEMSAISAKDVLAAETMSEINKPRPVDSYERSSLPAQKNGPVITQKTSAMQNTTLRLQKRGISEISNVTVQTSDQQDGSRMLSIAPIDEKLIPKHGVGDVLGKISQVFTTFNEKDTFSYRVPEKIEDVADEQLAIELQILKDKGALLFDLVEDAKTCHSLIQDTAKQLGEIWKLSNLHSKTLWMKIGELEIHRARNKRRRVDQEY